MSSSPDGAGKPVLNRRLVSKVGRMPGEQFTLLELDEIPG